MSEGIIIKIYRTFDKFKNEITHKGLYNSVDTISYFEDVDKIFSKRSDSVLEEESKLSQENAEESMKRFPSPKKQLGLINESIAESEGVQYCWNASRSSSAKSGASKMTSALLQPMISGLDIEFGRDNHKISGLSTKLYYNFIAFLNRQIPCEADGFKKTNDKYKKQIKNLLKELDEALTEEDKKMIQKDIDFLKLEQLILLMWYEAPNLNSGLIKTKDGNTFSDVVNTIKNVKISECSALNISPLNFEVLAELVKSNIQNLMKEEEIPDFLHDLYQKHSEYIRQSQDLASHMFVSLYRNKEVVLKHINFLKYDMENLESIQLCRERISAFHQIKLGLWFWIEKQTEKMKLVRKDECKIWDLKKKQEKLKKIRFQEVLLGQVSKNSLLTNAEIQSEDHELLKKFEHKKVGFW